jgi:hypothetical protein
MALEALGPLAAPTAAMTLTAAAAALDARLDSARLNRRLVSLLPLLLLQVVRRKLLMGLRIGEAKDWRGAAKRFAAYLMLLLRPVMPLRL